MSNRILICRAAPEPPQLLAHGDSGADRIEPLLAESPNGTVPTTLTGDLLAESGSVY